MSVFRAFPRSFSAVFRGFPRPRAAYFCRSPPAMELQPKGPQEIVAWLDTVWLLLSKDSGFLTQNSVRPIYFCCFFMQSFSVPAIYAG